MVALQYRITGIDQSFISSLRLCPIRFTSNSEKYVIEKKARLDILRCYILWQSATSISNIILQLFILGLMIPYVIMPPFI